MCYRYNIHIWQEFKGLKSIKYEQIYNINVVSINLFNKTFNYLPMRWIQEPWMETEEWTRIQEILQ